jgi:hypothetical protein
VDGGAPHGGLGHLWQRTGNTFETLTLTPSIDASPDWHGYVTSGQIVGGEQIATA